MTRKVPERPHVTSPVEGAEAAFVTQLLATFQQYGRAINEIGVPVAYTPEWTSTGTAPVLNDGTLTGYYWLLGDMCAAFMLLTAGASTTFGTGDWRFSLPFTSAGEDSIGPLLVTDASPTTFRTGITLVQADLDYVRGFVDSDTSAVAAAAPITWASGDKLRLNVVYPIAA